MIVLLFPPRGQAGAQLGRVALHALGNVVVEAVDFLDVGELLGAETHNLSRFEAAVKEQVGYASLAYIGQHRLQHLP